MGTVALIAVALTSAAASVVAGPQGINWALLATALALLLQAREAA